MLSDNLNTDKQHMAKLESFKENAIGRLVTIEGIEPEGFWGCLKDIEQPDPEYSLVIDCVAIVEVLDPEIIAIGDDKAYWAIPCDFNEIRILEIH